MKLKVDGLIERLKARLVAKGYTHIYGLDYKETFFAVVKMKTIRCMLSIDACQH